MALVASPHVTALADLPLIASGKVREMYDLSAAPAGLEAEPHEPRLLMVASDRISTYDAVHPTPIPDKGKVLTGLSVFWFQRTSHIVANHLVSATVGVPDEAQGRGLVVRRLRMLPVECVVRGYLTGSGWRDYQRSGAVSGIALPGGLRESERLPEPLFTPSTKADEGHDETIDFERAVELAGDRELMARARDASIELYSFAAEHALANGVILADTKFEFGVDEAASGGGEGLVVGDEVLTPDSSRCGRLAARGVLDPGLEGLAGDALVCLHVARAGALDHVGGDRRRRWQLVPAAGGGPVAHVLLVEARLRAPRLEPVRRPVARGVGREHLIAHDQLAVGVQAELELGVGEDHPPLERMLGREGVQLY